MTAAALERDPLLLAEGTRLVHIGPSKTGTSALQAALWGARESMREQGVHHAGPYRNPVSAVRAVTGQATSYSDRPPPMRDWRALVREIRAAREPRLVVSSEYFGHADTAAIRQIAGDLDASRLHVVVTLRPLARIIPSMWQQNVQMGQRVSFERWLRGLFPEPPATSTTPFWKVHRHDELIARWAEVVGLDRVTVVVVDDRDHTLVLRAFERMLGVRDGTLELERDRTNRSLTLGEAEAVRAFNVQFREAGLSRALHARVMRFGAAQHVKQREPGPDDLGIRLPAWSIDRVAATATGISERIGASGVRVVGDLATLAPPIVELDDEGTQVTASGPVGGPPAIAGALAMGVLISAGLTHGGATNGAAPEPEAAAADIPAWLVAGTIGNRMLASTTREAQELRTLTGRVRDRARRRVARARTLQRRAGGRYGKGRSPDIDGQRRMDPTPDRDPLLLPEGTILVHIGPPKTGTTALQGAFHATRGAAEAQGVHYAGRQRHSVSAVQAVLGKTGFYSVDTPPSLSTWRKLAGEARGSQAKRVVLSSEFFADAQPEAIRTIVGDLDPARVHVVVTLRPLARIIPSQWQQYVQSNIRLSFDDWLDAMFNKEPGKITPSFWNRHRHDRLIARWADVVGYENMTVVALDEGDHDFVLRAFERLTGLSAGTLVAPPEAANRSLTMPETEAVRAFNVAFRQEGLSRPLHSKVMNFGAARYMKEAVPPADAPRVETPQWALDRAGVVAREIVDAIAATGVRVVGDLESMTEVPTSHLAGEHQPPVSVPPSVAASMAMGVLFSSGLARDTGHKGDGDQKSWNRATHVPIRGEPIELVRVPTRDLFSVLVRRGTTSVRRRLPGGRKGAG